MRLAATLSLLLLCSQSANAGLAQDILDTLQNAVTCTGCHALLIPLKTLSIFGDKTFTKTLTTICKATKVGNASYPDILLDRFNAFYILLIGPRR